ncbi:hypothetical protein JCM33374_g3093 [Metschnikowia sp. JCM 33374]|nr:hypothetical protein JCM33374_g3093 [Metschnikowia sp. JCM 33374]
MSSAQAAASAAFSASKPQAAPPPQRQKPSFRINTDVGPSNPKSHTPRTQFQPDNRTSTPTPRTPRVQATLEPQNSTIHRHKSSHGGQKPNVTPSGGSSSGGPNSTPNSVVRRGSSAASKPALLDKKTTPVSAGPRMPRTPLGMSEDSAVLAAANSYMGSSSQVNFDYFSLPRSSSVSSHDLTSDSQQKKVQTSTKPQDMLESVRNSINSKSKIGTGKEAARKSQIAINEIRQSVDSKRLVSQTIGDRRSFTSHAGSSREEVYKDHPSRNSSQHNSEVELYSHAPANRSQSSIGSIISSDFNQVSASTNDTRNYKECGPAFFSPNFRISYCDSIGPEVSKKVSTDSEIVKKTSTSTEAPKKIPTGCDAPKKMSTSSDGTKKASIPEEPPSPIPIPLSSQGVDRGLAVTTSSSDALAKLSPSLANLISSSSDAIAEQDNLPTKPGRKKPPPSEEIDSSCEASGSDMESSSAYIESSDVDTDESEGIKFPLFPGISDKHNHRISLFSKKKKPRDKGVVYDPDALQPAENEHSIGPSLSRSSKKLASSSQPVKLRTTMRKEDRRKEKKTAFNEDKPWKNHGDLDVISDSQRKRYEGLWVSNKGLYLDRVATKLVGVDYEKEEFNVLSKSVREYSEKEISERAAKLSASFNIDSDSTDVKELHGLESVSTQNLIHGRVVQRIWNRSNLPRQTLQAIWDLVDFRKDTTLNKAEFIVGMWLVDQCLYGRKLPKVVNKSVWSSLGGLGVNVVIKKKRR